MRQGRIYVALCLLAGLWVAVYWLWDASPAEGPGSRITFATSPGEEPGEPEVPTHAPPAEEAPETGVVAPQFDTYVIQHDGETWTTISIAVYASPDHADAIQDANPFVVDLTPGKTIRVPVDPANTRGRPIGDVTPPASPTPETPRESEPEIIAEHTVADGEVLSAISSKYYGTSKHYRLIYEFNRERLGLRDEHSIRKGQVLLIPRAPDP